MDKKRLLGSYDGTKLYLYAILVMLVLQIAGSLIYSLASELLSLSQSADLNLNMFISLIFQIGFLCVTCSYLKKTNTKLLYSPFHEDKSLKRAGSIAIGTLIGIVCTVVCLFGFYALASCFDYFLYWTGFRVSYVDSYSVSNLIIMTIVTVIAAPICEELVFRGALLSGLVRKLGVLPSVLLSGLAFSLMHMNPSQTVYQFFLGCAIAYITIQSKSLIPAIFMHAANNLIALLLENVQGFYDLVMKLINWVEASTSRIVMFTIVSAALGIVVIFALGQVIKAINKKMFGKDEYSIEKETEEPEPQVAMPTYGYPVYNQYQNGGANGGPVIYGMQYMPGAQSGAYGAGYVNPADIDPFEQESDVANKGGAVINGDNAAKNTGNSPAEKERGTAISGQALANNTQDDKAQTGTAQSDGFANNGSSPQEGLQAGAQNYAYRFDPQTGQPVDGQNSDGNVDASVNGQPQGIRYDPQTGQPLPNAGNANGQPQGYRYDPQTGQPVSQGGGFAPNQNVPYGYGNNYGQPYGPGYGYPLRRRKRASYKKMLGIGLAVCGAMWVFNYLAVLFLNFLV